MFSLREKSCNFVYNLYNYNLQRTLLTILRKYGYLTITDLPFDVKSLFTSIPLQLALLCTKTAIQQSTITDRRHHGLACTEPLPYIDLISQGFWKYAPMQNRIIQL